MSIVGPDYISQDLLDALCDHMAEGESVRSFFRDERPDIQRNWFHVWLAVHGTDEQRTQYARAQEDRQDALFEQCFEIADENSFDTKITEHGTKIPDNEWISRSRLRVDTRFKALARMNPKKYGEKVTNEHTGPNGGPLQTQDVTLTPTEAKAISQALDGDC